MNKLIAIYLLVVNYVLCVTGNDVLGCGGFLKSHVQIDFSKVEVKLLTKQGTLKDKTNCAPNGYYFIPLYDKGEYILQLEPLPGWSFTPTKVNLVVDGKTDLCSQSKDINFIFKGFGITGRVESFGNANVGPEGVKVYLKSKEEVRSTETTAGGLFFFTPVYPGNYEVSITHPTWKLLKNSLSVKVTEGNTELPKNSLVIEGYDVTGSVSTDGEPIKGVIMLLFKSDNNKNSIKVNGCSKSTIDNLKLNEQFVCHVSTNEKGVFVFPSVSNGEYHVQPYYKGQNIHFTPSKSEFSIQHDSVLIAQNFEVSGFSIFGKVLNSNNGAPLGKAIVHVNGKPVAKTDGNGRYTLEKMKAGIYNIFITYDHMEFAEKALKINPNTLELPVFYPSTYEVCGKVISEHPQQISITRIGSTQHFVIESEANSGKFCKYLAPGKYEFTVAKSDNGLQFFPLSQVIEVASKPLFDIAFSQLKATVTGEVVCLNEKDCNSFNVLLKSTLNENVQELFAHIKIGKYKFEEIRPGSYEVRLTTNKFCWKSDHFAISVNTDKHQVPEFRQTGYSIIFSSTHDTKVTYTNQNNKLTTVDISKGTTNHCLEKLVKHKFNFEGCHIYEPQSVEYDPANGNNQINVVAKKHKLSMKIKAFANYGDIIFAVNADGVKSEEGPLSFKDGYYTLELYLMDSENVILTPKSDILYFNPPIKSFVGSDDCQDLGAQFQAIKGKVFKGKVTPPLPGVQIVVESSDSNSIMTETDSDGNYKLSPLDDSKTYKVTASKETYVLIGPDENGNFLAHKLAEIVVQVLDQDDNTPLQGALLSLSGGDSYRSNLQTNEDGKISFHSLSPSEYFLRPMMKEYFFQPASKIIDVKEGATVNVLLKGKRVAYSAFGQILSLNGEPEGKMIIMATGIDNCTQFSEETTSESNGQFRIRGLQPFCSYDIKVKGSFDEKEVIERSTPESLTINSVKGDVYDVKMIVYRPLQNADVLVKVYTENAEHYKTLRVKVTRETPTSFILHTTKVDVSNLKLSDENQGILVHLPSVPLDGKLYTIQIESTLSQYNKEKAPIHYFTSNSSFQFADLSFKIKSSNIEEQIKQTSVWTLLFIFAILFAIYNIDTVSRLVKNKLSNINLEAINFKTKQINNEINDNADIDQIVQSINATKRKPKPRKI